MNTDFYPYFTKKEMACKCGCGLLPLAEFMNVLVTVREGAGFSFHVTSGARCPDYEFKLTGKKTGPHVLRLAADFWIYLEQAYIMQKFAYKHGMYGIGVNQKDKFQNRFIHLDMIKPNTPGYSRPLSWSY